MNFLYIPVGIPQGTSLLACVKTHTCDEGLGITQGAGAGLCCDTRGFTRATAYLHCQHHALSDWQSHYWPCQVQEER